MYRDFMGRMQLQKNLLIGYMFVKIANSYPNKDERECDTHVSIKILATS